MKKQRSNSTSSNDPNSSSVAPQLPRTLERRPASYALAVGAGGAGLLSLAPAAKADIIYTPSSLSIYAVIRLRRSISPSSGTARPGSAFQPEVVMALSAGLAPVCTGGPLE